jgi:polyisoprenoid-binding protein YceI
MIPERRVDGGTRDASPSDMTTQETVGRFVPRETAVPVEDGDLERWEIEPRDSRLGFVLRHLIVSQIPGHFGRWGGTLFLDRRQPWLSSVHVWVELASIDTDSLERDEHIRSVEFLDVARFPRAEFKSSSIEPHGKALVIRGRLQLHGITHDLDLEVEPPAESGGGVRDVYQVRGRLDRQAYGLRWNQDLDFGGVVVGDEIEIKARVRVARREGDVTASLRGQ